MSSTHIEIIDRSSPSVVRPTSIPKTATPETPAGRFAEPHALEGESIARRMRALANNLWWSWQPEVGQLFRELDPQRWRKVNYNPLALLNEFNDAELDQRASELVLHSRVNYAYRRLQEYLEGGLTWGATHAGVLAPRPIAYFSAEFGLHESLPIYSGGLGVLAGDHVKSASDLGIPLVGIGLLYDQGYFNQRLDRDLWQQEDYIDTDVDLLPLDLVKRADGSSVQIEIHTPTGPLIARIWRVAVGRVTLLLLDSDVDGNRMEDRELTARLYGGDHRVRIRQELLLGVGGIEAGRPRHPPAVLHLNEGHSAFAGLEWIRRTWSSMAFPLVRRRNRLRATRSLPRTRRCQRGTIVSHRARSRNISARCATRSVSRTTS